MKVTLRRMAFAFAATSCFAMGAAEAQQSAPPNSKAAASKARQQQKAAAAPKADPATSQKSVEAGIASLQAGKSELAIQQLTAALNGGGLLASQTARALYHRGAAYRQQSKPALAIADLTSALWLKNGLNDADRAAAKEARAAAYREAGLPDQSTGDGASKTAAAVTPAVPAIVPAAPAPVAAKPAPGSPAKPVANTAWVTQQVPARAQPVPAPVPAPIPVAEPSSTGNFFSNLFSSAAPAASQQIETSAAKNEPVTQGWGTATKVTPSSAAPAPAFASQISAALAVAAPPPPTARQAPAASAAKGRFSVHLASAKDRQEALTIAQQLQSQFPGEFAGRSVEIVPVTRAGEAVYRLKVGPYAEAVLPLELCAKARGQGIDCMMTSD